MKDLRIYTAKQNSPFMSDELWSEEVAYEEVHDTTTQAEAEIEDWEEEIEDWEDEIEDWEDETQHIDDEIEDWEDEIEDWEDEIEDWEDETQHIDDEIEDWEDEIEDWEDEIEDWEDETQHIDDDIEDWEDEIEDWEDEIEDWEDETSYIDDEIEDWEDEIEDWEDEIEDWEDEAEYIDDEIEDWEDEFNSTEDGAYALEEDFLSSIRKLTQIAQQQASRLTAPKPLPTKAPNGRPLKLPVVSTSLPDSPDYVKYRSKHKKYGMPGTIAAMQWIGKEMTRLYPNGSFKLYIGDISQMGGGKISGHNSHRLGLDVDVQLFLNGKRIASGKEKPKYGKVRKLIEFKRYRAQRKYVRAFVDMVRRNPHMPVKVIFWRDLKLQRETKGLVKDLKNHHTHLHLRFCMPGNLPYRKYINKVYRKGEKKGNYKCKKSSKSPIPQLPLPAPPPSINKRAGLKIGAAVKYNRRKRRSIGWGKQIKLIYALLGFYSNKPSEAEFAKGVADWQRKNGFVGDDIDGKIGPNTWKRMKADILKFKALLEAGKSIYNIGKKAVDHARGAFGIGSGDTGSGSSSAKVPAGYKVVRRKNRRTGKRVPRGLSKYSKEKLYKKLISMRSRGLLPNITNQEIDLFQRIANVETSGKVQGLNTWDSAVVSSGFMQLTLQHGKMQKWIQRAPEAFARYGIRLTTDKSLVWTRTNKKTGKKKYNRQFGIVGASKQELRWGPWAQRFYKSGLDEEIIVAEVAEARYYIKKHLRATQRYLEKYGKAEFVDRMMNYYNSSAYFRGMLQAGYNNLPVAARRGALGAMRKAEKEGYPGIDRFLAIFKRTLQAGYDSLNDPEGAGGVIKRTQNGAIF